MAERRMFAKTIVLSDAFLDMPMSARCLYFTLGMLADDEGFVGNPKSIMRQCGASQDDMLALLQKRYVLSFDSGVIVIKHWKMNNYLQNDRVKKTTYIEEKSTLTIDDKGAYTEIENQMYTDCIRSVYIDKNSIDKVSIDNKVPYIDSNNNLCANSNDLHDAMTSDLHSSSMQNAKSKVCKSDIDDFFERIWKLYPVKKGKGQISDSKKQKLYKIGYDELARCVERYKRYLKKSQKEKYTMNGSTFFNSGYVDYLDCNWEGGDSDGYAEGVRKDFTKEEEERINRELAEFSFTK